MVGIQLLTVLVVGLLIALALQAGLACLGTAIALSKLRWQAASDSTGGISAIAGLGVLVSVNAILFAACFLATRFSQLETGAMGAIAGLVVWAAYLLLILWVGAVALSSVVGTLFTLTTGGLGRLIRTIQAAFQSPPVAELSEAEMRATVRQEVQATLHAWQSSLRLSQPEATPVPADSFWPTVATYLQTANPRQLTPKRLERKLQKWLATHAADPTELDTPALTHVVAQREDLSAKQKQRILAQVGAIASQHSSEVPAQAEHPVVSEVVQAVVGQAVGGVLTQVGEVDPGLTAPLGQWLEDSMQQVEALQQTAREQLTTLQQQTQFQLEQTRQTAAAAAWWLFGTVATAAISAALAGAWGAGAVPLQWVRVWGFPGVT